MSKWRLAKSLERLRYEVNVLYPKRSKVSDGARGDSAHAKRRSDHNPMPNGVVCAIDITHDPKSGADMDFIADHIVHHPHPALNYVIWDSRIASRKNKFQWIKYTGSNPHTKHLHISVKQAAARYDIEGTWLKNFGQDEKPVTPKLFVNDKPFNDFVMCSDTVHPQLSSLVKAINGVNGVKASLVWNAKTKTAKVTVRVDYEKIKMKLHVRSLNP